LYKYGILASEEFFFKKFTIGVTNFMAQKKIPVDPIWRNFPMDDRHFVCITKNDPPQKFWIIRDTDDKG